MDSPETGLMAFGERVQEALEAETQPAVQLRAARADLLEHVTSVPPPARAFQGLGLAAILAVALLGLGAIYNHLFLRPISFVTGSATGSVGDALEAGRLEPLRVAFSEGSQLVLHEGSRARVLATQASGARVLLESGVADVSIAHRLGRATRWRFEVGPFQVLVTGTQFELDWQPQTQSLSLTMKSGTVVLSGSCLPAPRVVGRGASLRLSCAKATPAREFVQAEPGTSAATHAGSTQPSAAASAKTLLAEREPKPLARSFEASCEVAAKAELVLWANQDRLAGRLARARTALLTLRRRFAGTREAATAAFTLGRMEFDQQADYAAAARWFAMYLAEQPSGPLMGDAAGRLLEAHERQGNLVSARRDAQAYLRRFPDGPYASQAKRILSE